MCLWIRTLPNTNISIINLSNHDRKYKIPSTFSQIFLCRCPSFWNWEAPEHCVPGKIPVCFGRDTVDIFFVSFHTFHFGKGGTFFLLCFRLSHLRETWQIFPLSFSQLGISAGLAQMPNHQNKTHGVGCSNNQGMGVLLVVMRDVSYSVCFWRCFWPVVNTVDFL